MIFTIKKAIVDDIQTQKSATVIFFIFPAVVSLILSLINIAFINQFCPETLPIGKRVSIQKFKFLIKNFFNEFQDAKKTTMTDVYNALVPWQLFKFNAIHNVKSVDGK